MGVARFAAFQNRFKFFFEIVWTANTGNDGCRFWTAVREDLYSTVTEQPGKPSLIDANTAHLSQVNLQLDVKIVETQRVFRDFKAGIPL